MRDIQRTKAVHLSDIMVSGTRGDMKDARTLYTALPTIAVYAHQ